MSSSLALRRAVLLALAATACEVVAGLTGTRDEQPLAPNAAGCGEDRGICSETGGAGGTGGTGGSSENSAGAGEQAGERATAGMSGAAGSDGGASVGCGESDTPSVAPRSCDQAEQCNGESACTTLCVPGGPFLMGRGDQTDAYPGGDNELPEHNVTLSPYWLDKYEVTVGRFRRFVESYDGNKPARGAGAHPRVPASGWKSEWNDYLPADRAALEATLIANSSQCNPNYRTWTPAPGNSECLPVNCVDWYISFAFCAWDGGRLPSEAEWEFAAAAGDQNRLFPWGPEPPDDSRAVLGCLASGTSDCSPADIRPVGSRPSGNGFWGQADLAGSLLERTRDVYDPEFYGTGAALGSDIINLSFDATEGGSPIRGGGYLSSAADLRAAYRNTALRASPWDGVGWRCARGP
ncbi:MAG: formylglycine-generating enzyme family protein [Pseudomonadota bacterium]